MAVHRLALCALFLILASTQAKRSVGHDCSELIGIEAIQAGQWTATLHIPLNPDLSKFSDHWEVRVQFSHPVIDIQGVSAQLSTRNTINSDSLNTSTFSTTTLAGNIISRQLNTKTFELRQNVYIDRNTFYQPNITLDITIQVAFPGTDLNVETVTYSNVLVCTHRT